MKRYLALSLCMGIIAGMGAACGTQNAPAGKIDTDSRWGMFVPMSGYTCNTQAVVGSWFQGVETTHASDYVVITTEGTTVVVPTTDCALQKVR